MAINVRTEYYWIEAPEAYNSKAQDLALIAGIAKRFNRMDLYNQAKDAYLKLSNWWKQEGETLAKKKTSINWIGAGKKYMVNSMMPWEFYDKFGTAFAEIMPLEECAEELKKALSKQEPTIA